MDGSELCKRVQERMRELSVRLNDAMKRAVETKAQYEEIETFMNIATETERKELEKLRQSKLSENSIAVQEVNEILAKLRIHEELMNILAKDNNSK